MVTDVEAATLGRTLVYYQTNLAQAQKELSKARAGSYEYGAAIGHIRDAERGITETQAKISGLDSSAQAVAVKKAVTISAQQEGTIKGPTAGTTAKVSNMASIPIPSGLRQALSLGMGGGAALALTNTLSRAVPVATTATSSSVRTLTTGQKPAATGGLTGFIQQHPTLSIVGSGLIGAAAGALGGYALGKSRAVNPRTGKPYRRMNPQNNKALSRAVRRINAYTKANNRVEKALRAAARSAK